MAKKLGKLTLISILAGAAAGAGYYYLQKRAAGVMQKSEDDDDPDDFYDDLDDDFSDDSSNSADAAGRTRPHVSIDLDNAREIIGEKVIETIDKTKEKLEQLNVPEKLDKAKEIISDRISPAASAEPEYTEMDMSSSPAQADDAPAEDNFDNDALGENNFTDDIFDENAFEESPFGSEDSVSKSSAPSIEEFFDDTYSEEPFSPA